MSNFNDKINKNIAEIVTKIMEADLSTKQKEIAKISEPKDKIDADDLKKLRADTKSVKEQKQYEPEKPDPDAIARRKRLQAIKDKREDEEMRKIRKPMNPTMRRVSGKAYGGAAQKDDVNEETEANVSFSEYIDILSEGGLKNLNEAMSKSMGRVMSKLGSMERMRNVRVPSPAERTASGTLKSKESSANTNVKTEEVDSETFEKEMKDQKDKFDGKKKGADVAKASVQAVKQEEVEQIDEISKKLPGRNTDKVAHPVEKLKKQYVKSYRNSEKLSFEPYVTHPDPKINAPYRPNFNKSAEETNQLYDKLRKHISHKSIMKLVGEEVELEERTLTEPEQKKKEEVVKSMKKNLAGFKDRYGDRSKEVIYGTATRIAKEKA